MIVFRVQAFAFVEIFAEAGMCGCELMQFVAVETVEDIFAQASAGAYAEACVSAIPLTTYPQRDLLIFLSDLRIGCLHTG